MPAASSSSSSRPSAPARARSRSRPWRTRRSSLQAPEMGDEVQALKAGLLEVADLSSSTRPTDRAPSGRRATSRRCSWPRPRPRPRSGQSHRLHQDEIEAGGVEHGRGGDRRRREPAGVATRRHGADEHVRVARVLLHPDPVAEQRAAGDRARWIDRDDADGTPGRPRDPRQRGDERRLAGAGRPGDPDEMRRPACG